VHDASLMHHTDIFATAAKAATNATPVLHLRDTRPRRCTQTMLFCHGSAKRCLKEVKIAPPNPTFLEPIGHGVMTSHTAPSADNTQC
jgi:hypothetical protein